MKPTKVIFITEEDDHYKKIEAFKLKAAKYLLKPIDQDRMRKIFSNMSSRGKSKKKVKSLY
jgi:DNA-binding NtrC family response regulator